LPTTWKLFERIGAAKPDIAGNLDEKVDSLMTAAVERIADGLASMGKKELQEGAAAARAALEQMEEIHPMDPISPAFIGGRLASAADLLGFAASRAAQEAAASMAKRSPYAQTLSELSRHPLRNRDLGDKLGKSEAHICRILRELRDLDLVAPQRRGREVFNVLTPIGRMMVEEGIQQERRRPLATTNIADLEAASHRKFALVEMAPQTPVHGTELPRLTCIS
jgi:DNA-binding MarR family transcriptional regulator